MKSINSVIESGMCSGCGLCVEKESDMYINGEGFSRPKKIIDDDISNYNCPSISVSHYNVDAQYDDFCGPVISCNVAYSLDDKVRHSSSSGGVITELLLYLIEIKKIDKVIHVGVDEDNPIRNKTFSHSSKNIILKNSGSRYSPSSPLSIIRDALDDELRYAIVGKPCDINAIRSLIEKNKDHKLKFPYLFSFMCAGVPSEEGTKKVLEKLNVREKDLISFRYRGNGWPGLTTAVCTDGSEASMKYNDSWGNILNRYLQPRCKVCADGIGESSDIVCGDAWHSSNNGYPSFEEEKGRSLTITRTNVGEALLRQAIKDGRLHVDEYQTDDVGKIQPYQINRKQSILARNCAINILGGKVPKYKGYKLFKNALNAKKTFLLKVFFGTFIRKIKGRL